MAAGLRRHLSGVSLEPTPVSSGYLRPAAGGLDVTSRPPQGGGITLGGEKGDEQQGPHEDKRAELCSAKSQREGTRGGDSILPSTLSTTWKPANLLKLTFAGDASITSPSKASRSGPVSQEVKIF